LDGSNLTRMTVADAADRLGVTQDAIRQRIRRDSIAHEKDESGRVYVYLDATNTDHDGVHDRHHDAVRDTVHDALVEELRKQNEFLRAELERKDAILLTMAQRIPELEAASEPPDARQTPGEGPEGVGDPAPHAEGPQQRPSWWRRFFGL
jgi:hypothetical protein